MREWWSASELADLRLPGLPGTRRGVHKKATECGWLRRDERAESGGRPASQYHLSELPPQARAALVLLDHRREREFNPAPDPSPITRERSTALWQGWERKPQSIKDEAQRRFDALQAVTALIADGSGKLETYGLVAEQLGESVPALMLRISKRRGRSSLL